MKISDLVLCISLPLGLGMSNPSESVLGLSATPRSISLAVVSNEGPDISGLSTETLDEFMLGSNPSIPISFSTLPIDGPDKSCFSCEKSGPFISCIPAPLLGGSDPKSGFSIFKASRSNLDLCISVLSKILPSEDPEIVDVSYEFLGASNPEPPMLGSYNTGEFKQIFDFSADGSVSVKLSEMSGGSKDIPFFGP